MAMTIQNKAFAPASIENKQTKKKQSMFMDV